MFLLFVWLLVIVSSEVIYLDEEKLIGASGYLVLFFLFMGLCSLLSNSLSKEIITVYDFFAYSYTVTGSLLKQIRRVIFGVVGVSLVPGIVFFIDNLVRIIRNSFFFFELYLLLCYRVCFFYFLQMYSSFFWLLFFKISSRNLGDACFCSLDTYGNTPGFPLVIFTTHSNDTFFRQRLLARSNTKGVTPLEKAFGRDDTVELRDAAIVSVIKSLQTKKKRILKLFVKGCLEPTAVGDRQYVVNDLFEDDRGNDSELFYSSCFCLSVKRGLCDIYGIYTGHALATLGRYSSLRWEVSPIPGGDAFSRVLSDWRFEGYRFLGRFQRRFLIPGGISDYSMRDSISKATRRKTSLFLNIFSKWYVIFISGGSTWTLFRSNSVWSFRGLLFRNFF